MAGASPDEQSSKAPLEERRFELEEARFNAETDLKRLEEETRARADKAARQQAIFDRRYRLLELKERKADRELKSRELDLNQGSGIKFTSAQATVAAAVLALLSALLGAFVQGWFTRGTEEVKNNSLIAIEELKAKANIALEDQKQKSNED